MKCDEIQKRLVAYVDDELDPISKDKVKYHLEQCPQCKAQLEEITKMFRLYKSVPELKPQAGEFERIMESISFATTPQKKQGKLSKLWNWFTLKNKVLRWAPASAAALIIFLLIGTFVLKPFVLKKKTLAEKSTTVYTYYEYVAKEKPSEATPKFGKYSLISIY